MLIYHHTNYTDIQRYIRRLIWNMILSIWNCANVCITFLWYPLHSWTWYCIRIIDIIPETNCIEYGQIYDGDLSVTWTGKSCIPWTVVNDFIPEILGRATLNDFPDDSWDSMENKCRLNIWMPLFKLFKKNVAIFKLFKKNVKHVEMSYILTVLICVCTSLQSGVVNVMKNCY